MKRTNSSCNISKPLEFYRSTNSTQLKTLVNIARTMSNNIIWDEYRFEEEFKPNIYLYEKNLIKNGY